jgi:hypothetical protein
MPDSGFPIQGRFAKSQAKPRASRRISSVPLIRSHARDESVIRMDVVTLARQKIAMGLYDDPEVFAIALSKMVASIES